VHGGEYHQAVLLPTGKGNLIQNTKLSNVLRISSPSARPLCESEESSQRGMRGDPRGASGEKKRKVQKTGKEKIFNTNNGVGEVGREGFHESSVYKMDQHYPHMGKKKEELSPRSVEKGGIDTVIQGRRELENREVEFRWWRCSSMKRGLSLSKSLPNGKKMP